MDIMETENQPGRNKHGSSVVSALASGALVSFGSDMNWMSPVQVKEPYSRVHPRMGPIHFVRKLLMFC